MSKPPLITVDNLRVDIAGQTILNNINLVVHQGKVVTLIGPNGAGKSTLVKTILGLIKPTAGKVSLLPGLKVGYMPQKLAIGSLMPLTVKRFLLLNNERNIESYKEIIVELKIEHLVLTPLQSVSGGELQRILLARALLNDPDLLVLDEPVQGVDITGQTELYDIISKICVKYKCGILMVSHDLHLVMASTDEVICLNKHVCCSGHPEAVSAHPQFLQLFGAEVSEKLAVYAHHHNHKHDSKGRVIDDN